MAKILIITLEYPPEIGGIATYVSEQFLSFPADAAVVLQPTLSRWFYPRWLGIIFTVWRAVNQSSITEIYIHHALPIGYVGLVLNIGKKIPYTIFFHGADITSKKSTTRWKRFCLRLVVARAESLVVNSLAMKQRLVDWLMVKADKIQLVYPKVNKDFFTVPDQNLITKTKDHYALPGKKVVLAVARLSEGKGLPLLIRYFPAVLQKVPNAILLIAGDGEKRNFLLNLISELNLQNCVRLVGALPRGELRSLYACADVFALLTHTDEVRGIEAFGLVFAEAGASGLPVVAGETGGVSEVVQNEKTGFVVVAQQKNSVVEKICQLLLDPVLAKQMGEAGREFVRKNFS